MNSHCRSHTMSLESILKAICFIRSSKKRPTAERIFNGLHRLGLFKNGFAEKKLECDLNEYVKSGHLVSSDKNGVLSYVVCLSVCSFVA